MIEKSDSIRYALTTIAILGHPPNSWAIPKSSTVAGMEHAESGTVIIPYEDRER